MLFDVLASFIYLACLFGPLECAFPARGGQNSFRREWFVDVGFFAGQYLIWVPCIFWLLHACSFWLDAIITFPFREAVGRQPFWLQVVTLVIISDFLLYWMHRLQHKVDFLWRFHATHHTATRLDWLAAYREHPVDALLTIGVINLPFLVAGFRIESIAMFAAFRGLWAIYIHANVRLPLGFFAYLIGSPQFHHWHHDVARNRGNYANLCPLWDVLFGTAYHAPHGPGEVGIRGFVDCGYFRHIVVPLCPKRQVVLGGRTHDKS